MKADMNLDKELDAMSELLRNFPKQSLNSVSTDRIADILKHNEAKLIRRHKLTLTLKRAGVIGLFSLVTCLFILLITPQNPWKDQLITWGVNISASLQGNELEDDPDHLTDPLIVPDQNHDQQNRDHQFSPPSDAKEWEVSSAFMFETYTLIGQKAEYGVMNAVFTKNEPMKVLWFLFNQTREELGETLTVTATSAKTGEKIELVKSSGFGWSSSWSGQKVHTVHSLLTFPEIGLWKLELETDKQQLGTIVVEVFDELEKEGFNSIQKAEEYDDQFTYNKAQLTGREGHFGLVNQVYISEESQEASLYLFDPVEQYTDSRLSITADHAEGWTIPIFQGKKLASFKTEEGFSISIPVNFPQRGQYYLNIYINHKAIGSIPLTVHASTKEKIIDEFAEAFSLDLDYFHVVPRSLIMPYTDREVANEYITQYRAFVPMEISTAAQEEDLVDIHLMSGDEQHMYIFRKKYDGTNILYILKRPDNEQINVFSIENQLQKKGKILK